MKKLLAKQMLENEVIRDVLQKTVGAPARRELERQMIDRSLSERQIVALAHQHKRYGVGMIHLKPKQAGVIVNHKHLERVYQEARLQVCRRKRKKVPPAEQHLLPRPTMANEVWSIDFVFDRTADGRAIKCLTVFDDATHEAIVIGVERAISGIGVTRVFDGLALSRGLPKVIRSDNGNEFCGDAKVNWNTTVLCNCASLNR